MHNWRRRQNAEFLYLVLLHSADITAHTDENETMMLFWQAKCGNRVLR